ncbi:MAG: hypothetical protein N2259_02520 [Patescibacteria group bacterium]|nr:hypothetical protein [Patescibacteria group bacterium]
METSLNLTTGFVIFLLAISLFQLIRYFFSQGKIRQWIFKKELTIEEKTELLRWRTLMRPLGVFIIIFYFLFGKTIILFLIGLVSVIFILVDVSRLSFQKFNIFLLKNLFIKQKEIKIFSSMSLFTSASFIFLLIFEKRIAFLAILYLVFGDLFAKVIGTFFGRQKFFTKTLEGTLAYFTSCLLFGFFFSYFFEISSLTMIVGAFTAAFSEALPLGIDDNFSVDLLSATTMYLVNLIFV